MTKGRYHDRDVADGTVDLLGHDDGGHGGLPAGRSGASRLLTQVTRPAFVAARSGTGLPFAQLGD